MDAASTSTSCAKATRKRIGVGRKRLSTAGTAVAAGPEAGSSGSAPAAAQSAAPAAAGDRRGASPALRPEMQNALDLSSVGVQELLRQQVGLGDQVHSLQIEVGALRQQLHRVLTLTEDQHKLFKQTLQGYDNERV